MLAQNFKPAADLDLTEPQKEALMKTLVLLETGKLQHVVARGRIVVGAPVKFDGRFNMACWGTAAYSCGTVACIGGTAELIGKVSFGNGLQHKELLAPALYELFYARSVAAEHDWESITPAQAATALRSYLTTGDARWDLAVA